MKRLIVASVIALSIIGGAATGASAARIKNCGEQPAGPGNSGMTQTETQIAACGSNSDTGEELGPVTNRGGGTPPGQQ
jgi:hypothetical protein